MASAINKRKIGKGDVVSIIAPNTPAMLEAHYGVIMSGAVLNALNYRLDAPTIAFILEHGASKLVMVDKEFSSVMEEAFSLMKKVPEVIGINDELAVEGELLGKIDYETFLMEGDADYQWPRVKDEWDSMALNYTSGTTGNPKGVVFHHRGAFLNAMGNAVTFGLDSSTSYLWTLPMFHCNGWTFTWGVTAVGGCHVCLRSVDPELIFKLIEDHKVSHMCGAPIGLNMLVHAPDNVKKRFNHLVQIATGGAAPPSAVIAAMEKLVFKVLHLYGLT
jgi:fatty-acyl-CoA synthase